jgi:hypothetical protein
MFSWAICGNVYEDGSRKICVFSVPKNLFSRWKSIIPELKETARLCDIHFEESDIVKGFKNVQNFHPLKNLRLLQSAIPKFVLGNITNVLLSIYDVTTLSLNS